MPEITDDAGLREVVAEPPRAVAAKATDRVDDESRRFLEASPFFLLATTGADGSVDVSPRGDPAGGVLVLDDGRAVAFGDRKGNRRLDSLRNILANKAQSGTRLPARLLDAAMRAETRTRQY